MFQVCNRIAIYTSTSQVLKLSLLSFPNRFAGCPQCYSNGDDSIVSHCLVGPLCHHHLCHHWPGDVLRPSP